MLFEQVQRVILAKKYFGVRCTLTNIAKFNYLVTQLEGATSCATAGLLITKDNYQAAVDILIKRFGEPQQIIASHMDELLKILVCSSERPSQLR